MFCYKLFTPYSIKSLTHKHFRVVSLSFYATYIKKHTFTGVKDNYNGVTVDSTTEKCNINDFTSKLKESLVQWIAEGRRCIWFKINIKDSTYIPILAQKGFNFHHAREDFVMMFKWLPEDSQPNLPPACHTNLGVGAMVFNKQKKILAVSEKHYKYPHWKLPGGYVERGEDIVEAGIREVEEETGVKAAFESLITFRHSHNMMYGNSDIYLLMMMKAISDKITISDREVKDCKWMDVEEYIKHPHVHEFNRLVINKAQEYRNKKIKLDFPRKAMKFPTHVRVMNYLTIEDCVYK